MKIVSSIPEMKTLAGQMRASGRVTGIVPTMGFLHEGHLSLVRESRSRCGFTVVTLFVNPTQFGPNEDYDTYPVDLEGDLSKLKAENVDVVFLPDRQSMFPEEHKTFVTVEDITSHLCGKSRPGFFRGVTTVVLKLFNIVQPHQAFFGEKDWQQVTVVETMVRDLNLDVQIIRMPLVRDADGMAMSSRNRYLSESERVSARSLSRALEDAKVRIQGGERSAESIRKEIRSKIEKQHGAEIDYISICDPETFLECNDIRDRTLIALAVRVGKARLIDNCLIESVTCKE